MAGPMPHLLSTLYLFLTPSISLPLERLGGRSHVTVTQKSKKGKDLSACYIVEAMSTLPEAVVEGPARPVSRVLQAWPW